MRFFFFSPYILYCKELSFLLPAPLISFMVREEIEGLGIRNFTMVLFTVREHEEDL